MDDMLIGPGRMCSECGEVYGQHSKGCSVGREKKRRVAQQQAEDSISKRDLLKRIKALERLIKKEGAAPMSDLERENKKIRQMLEKSSDAVVKVEVETRMVTFVRTTVSHFSNSRPVYETEQRLYELFPDRDFDFTLLKESVEKAEESAAHNLGEKR